MPGAVQGSPAVKTATLSRASAALAAGVLRQLDESVAQAQVDTPQVEPRAAVLWDCPLPPHLHLHSTLSTTCTSLHIPANQLRVNQ